MLSLSFAHMPLLVQAGVFAVVGAAFLAFFLIVGLRFARRGAARFWTAPGSVALALLPAVLGAGIGSLAFRQTADAIALTGSGGVAALAAGSAEALVPLFAGLVAVAPLAFVGLLLTSFGSSRTTEGASGGGLLLAAMAPLTVLLSAGVIALLVHVVASVNGGARDGSSLLLQLNLALAGSAFLAFLLFVLLVATAFRAPRGPSPLPVKLAAVASFSLCGLLAVAGAWIVYSNTESYVRTALTGSSEDALPEPVGADLGDAPPPEAPPPPPPPPGRGRVGRADTGPEPVQRSGSVVRVGGTIKEPKKLKNVPPVYPDVAKQARVQGVVILEATIDPQGRVSAVKILRGVPLLDQAAADAVRQWVYTPTLLNGEPVPVIMTVTVNFRLN